MENLETFETMGIFELNDQVALTFCKKLHKQYLEFAVEVLNQALERDPKAISTMMTQRFDCNKALTEHPTIQTGERDLGVIGLINGLFGVDKDGRGFIAGIWETDQNNGLDRLVGFKLLEDRLEL